MELTGKNIAIGKISDNLRFEQRELRCARCGEPSPESMTSYFIFMRHGQTLLNEQGIIVGSIDDPMSEAGFAQAREAAERWKEKVELIVSSEMIRAKQTADIFKEKFDVPIEYDHRLRERCVGADEGKQDEVPGTSSPLHDLFLREDYQPKCATPLKEFEEETKEFLRDAAEKYKGKRVLFITHGFRLLTIIKLIRGWDVGRITKYKLPANCEAAGFYAGEACVTCGNRFYEEKNKAK